MANDPSSEDWSPATVTDAVRDLQAEGYLADFSVAPGGMLRCGQCGTLHDPAEAHVDRIARFEGESDPGDEAIVFALTCTDCGLHGTLVSAYGASVGNDEATVVTGLTSRR
jgi:hypothetical protein